MTNQSITFEIEYFREGTEKQKAIGIHATFTVNIRTPDGILASLSDVRLRKKMDSDEWFIEGPYTEYKDKDGKNRKRHFYRVWPEKENWNKQDILTAKAKSMLGKPAPEKRQQPAPSASTPQKNQSSSRPKAENWA